VNRIQTQPDFSQGTDRGNRGFGQQLTISGARAQQNNYRLDGVSLNDYANGAPGSRFGRKPGVDAIQEFSVLTSNYSAEYGKTSGGVVNAITRSGTNQIHGSVYESFGTADWTRKTISTTIRSLFHRLSETSSVERSADPSSRAALFSSLTMKASRQSKGITTVTTVPSAAARSGNLLFDS